MDPEEDGVGKKRKASIWMECWDGKSLYLCFEKGLQQPNNDSYFCENHVHTIKIKDLMSSESDDDGNSTFRTRMQTAAYFERGIPLFGCGVYGENILFAGGKGMNLGWPCPDTDTAVRSLYYLDTHKPEFRDSPPYINRLRPILNFLVEKCRPILVELGEKLYALPGPPLHLIDDPDLLSVLGSFEVLDLEIRRWRPLPSPPYLDTDNWGSKRLPEAFCVALVGSSIIVSCPEQPGRLFSFNTVTLEWTDGHLSDRSASPFPWDGRGNYVGRNLVVGDLMFAYAADGSVSVFRIHDQFRYTLIHLEQLSCRQVLPADEHEFVHLGGQYVALVLNKHERTPDDVTKWRFAVVIFRYDGHGTKAKSSRGAQDPSRSITATGGSLNLQVLKTHFFHSSNKANEEKNRYYVALRGAYILDTRPSEFDSVTEGEWSPMVV